MTELLFFKDPYLKETKAKVIEKLEEGVVFDKTIFFGKSCGVKPDKGKLYFNGHEAEVLSIKKSNGKFIHIIKGDCPEIFTEVNMKINWNRRYAMMKYHTALHIISTIIWKKYTVLVTGSDINVHKSTIDFEFNRNLNKEELEILENEINSVISKNHKISSEYMSIELALNTPGIIRTKSNLLPKGIKEVRLVKIGNVDLQADGGLHVQSTNEIGRIKIVKHKNKGKGRRRIEIIVEEESFI